MKERRERTATIFLSIPPPLLTPCSHFCRFIAPETIEGVECRSCYVVKHSACARAALEELEAYNTGGLDGAIRDKKGDLERLAAIDLDGDGPLPAFWEPGSRLGARPAVPRAR